MARSAIPLWCVDLRYGFFVAAGFAACVGSFSGAVVGTTAGASAAPTTVGVVTTPGN